MFERPCRFIKPLIAALIFGVALSGCTQKTEAEPHPEYGYSATATPNEAPLPKPAATYPDGVAMNGLKACFKTPPQETKRAENDDWTNARIVLQHNPQTGSVVGDPGPLAPAVEKKVRGAIVEIEDVNGSGSGFLVEPDVVITAAHVPDSVDMSVTDSRGRKAKVVGGCYVHQRDGLPVDLSYQRSVSLDIAILRLDRKLGASVLKIAATPPKRSDWVTLVNAQGDFTAQNPAVYNSLALTGNSNEKGATLLTGIAPNGSEDYKSFTAMGGCSGGAAVNRKGEVVGLSFASVDPGNPDLLRWLPIDYGVQTPTQPNNSNLLTDPSEFGWHLSPASIVTSDLISYALTSPNY